MSIKILMNYLHNPSPSVPHPPPQFDSKLSVSFRSEFNVEICNPSELHMHSLAAGTFANVLEFSLVAASLLNKDQVHSLKPCCYVASYWNVPYTVLKAFSAQGFFIRFEEMTSCQINSYEGCFLFYFDFRQLVFSV